LSGLPSPRVRRDAVSGLQFRPLEHRSILEDGEALAQIEAPSRKEDELPDGVDFRRAVVWPASTKSLGEAPVGRHEYLKGAPLFILRDQGPRGAELNSASSSDTVSRSRAEGLLDPLNVGGGRHEDSLLRRESHRRGERE